ncbi:MAG: peptidylprolyl isomerase [Candidatus Riflebacteria bacterium]|nr:peptidylprolyl isomerase [Candidatus Riflebacteria bacterium]
MKKHFLPVLVIAALLSVACSSAKQKTPSAQTNSSQGSSVQKQIPAKADISLKNLKLEKQDNPVINILTPRGDIVVELFPDSAPKHVESMLDLIKKQFYNGLTFHRVIPGFVIQGGCPLGNGTGDAGYKLPAEFNKRPHLKGTLAMARAQDPNSAGSQFYICLDDTPHLDGQYTVFGQVVSGHDVPEKVKQGDKMEILILQDLKADK